MLFYITQTELQTTNLPILGKRKKNKKGDKTRSEHYSVITEKLNQTNASRLIWLGYFLYGPVWFIYFAVGLIVQFFKILIQLTS